MNNDNIWLFGWADWSRPYQFGYKNITILRIFGIELNLYFKENDLYWNIKNAIDTIMNISLFKKLKKRKALKEHEKRIILGINNRCNIIIDKTLGYYDNQLGEYIGSTSDKRRILKEKGLIEVKSGTDDYVRKVEQKSDHERKEEYKQILKDNAYKHNIPIHGMN